MSTTIQAICNSDCSTGCHDLGTMVMYHLLSMNSVECNWIIYDLKYERLYMYINITKQSIYLRILLQPQLIYNNY